MITYYIGRLFGNIGIFIYKYNESLGKKFVDIENWFMTRGYR
jgi:hypothetical protein